MSNLIIRCHPGRPQAVTELSSWLEQEVGRLHTETPDGEIALSSLSHSAASGGGHAGWLIELSVPGAHGLAGRGRLAGVLRDMRLLGMAPTVLTAAADPDAAEDQVPALATERPAGDDDVAA